MKTQARTKKRNLWRNVLDGLRSAAKIIRRKFAEKGNSFQPFPNEAPH